MESAEEILNFNFSDAKIQRNEASLFNLNLLSLIELRTNRLNTITNEVGIRSFANSGESSIPNIFKKFKNITANSEVNLTSIKDLNRRELKTLSYYLNYAEPGTAPIIKSSYELNLILKTLDRTWKDSFLFGLIHSYLRSWESEYKNLSLLGKFIINKLKIYNGARRNLLSIQNHLKYFDAENGDIILGTDLALKKINLTDTTKYLALPQDWFTYPYFSKVIDTYYEKRKSDVNEIIDDLFSSLKIHKSSVTNRRTLSKLIVQVHNSEFIAVKPKVKRIALELLLDPQKKDSIWNPFEYSSTKEVQDLEVAKRIMNQWIAEEFINVFFEKCINNPRRKKFWLKYAKEITQFKVVGSNEIKRILMEDSRIKEYVVPRFGILRSQREGNAALMFTMNNYLFIEFSDEGAFYAYKISNPYAPSIDQTYFGSIGSLKDSSMPRVAYRTGIYVDSINEEGKCPHADGTVTWEGIAKYWIEKMVKVYV